MAKKKKEDEIALRDEAGELALLNEMTKVAGAGFEDADMDAYAVPFLRILQTNSPQVNEDEESYIDGAKPGMFFNTITRKLYDKKVKVVPVYYHRDFVEWQPDRGGYVRSHGPDPSILDGTIQEDQNNILPNGNIIQDTRNHYVVLADHLADGPIILSLTSTGLRHSKRWMTNMKMLKLPNKEEAPMFSSVYEISSILNENDKGKWYQVGDQHLTAIERLGWVNQDQWSAALAATDLIVSGKTRADYDSTIDAAPEPGSTADDTPF